MDQRPALAGLAAKARTIYGAKHEEFIDSVKAYAYFPYAVAKNVDDFHDGEISMVKARTTMAELAAPDISAAAATAIDAVSRKRSV